MRRVYTFRVARPDNPMALSRAMAATAELVRKHNKFVDEAKVQLDGDDILLVLTLKGIDQWWIKKRVVFPVAAILVNNGLQLKDARLEAVDRPEDRRSTRPRASDGRSTPLAENETIDHSDLTQAART